MLGWTGWVLSMPHMWLCGIGIMHANGTDRMFQKLRRLCRHWYDGISMISNAVLWWDGIFNPSMSIPYLYAGPPLVISVPADIGASPGVRPAAGTTLITNQNGFCKLSINNTFIWENVKRVNDGKSYFRSDFAEIWVEFLSDKRGYIDLTVVNIIIRDLTFYGITSWLPWFLTR